VLLQVPQLMGLPAVLVSQPLNPVLVLASQSVYPALQPVAAADVFLLTTSNMTGTTCTYTK
jgi:hypothetical protein